MNEEMLIKKLLELGLTSYEAKVYRAVVCNSNACAAELATAAAIPRPKVYQVLTQLSEKGLITETLGKKKQFQVIDPAIAFSNLEKSLDASYQEKKQIFDHLPHIFQEMLQSHRQAKHPLHFIQVIKQNEAATRKVQTITNEAQEEILFFTCAPYLKPVESNQEGLSPLERGVKVHSIYVAGELMMENHFPGVKAFAEAGEQVRIVQQLPIKMAVIDSRIVLLMLVDNYAATTSFTTMVIEHPDLAKTFKIVFEFFWQQGKTLEQFEQTIKEQQ
jgi:sugar-specific transcriptional regulator TrmB